MTRAALIRQARIYLKESRDRRGKPMQRGFTFPLLHWAAECRRKAAAMKTAPDQFDLFGDIA